MDNRPISELDSAISVNDEDILLISQKENNEYVSRKIGAGVFRGDSAYDLAVKEGFKGDLNAWLSSIKGWQPITSGEFVGLLDSELDKSKLYKDLNNRLNASTTSLKEDIAKQLNDVNNLRQQVIAEADKRIQEIHNLNTGLIEEANKRIQDIKLIQESITLETSERLEQAVELANQILLEKDSRTDDIKNLIEKLNSEQSDRVAAVQQVIDLLSSEIETRRSLLSETVQKINKETSDRVKEIEAVRNSITQEQLTRVSELEDIMEDIDAVDAKVGTNHSFLLNNYSTTKTASEETAKQIEALRTTYIDPKLEQKASTTALEQITTKVGTINDALQANITKTDGVFAKVNPSMAGTESGYIGDESKYVGVWTEQSARIEEDFALGKRVDNVVATYTSNKETTDARIAREEKARADGDSALASVVTSLTTRVGQSEGKLVTLEQVNTDLDSSLSQISTKLDNTIQEVSTKASSSVLDELASNVEVLEGSVSSTTNSITALENSLETTNTNLNKKADSAAVNELSSKVTAIDETVNSNSSNIIALTNSLGSKNKTYYQPLVPTENVSVGDIWVNSTPSRNNELKRYNGLYWDVISDPRVSSNSSAISALESKTTQHDEELTSQSSLITDLKADLDVSKQDLLLKADSSALNDLSNTVSSIGGNISSVSGDVTELKNNLETLETNIQTKASATALEDLSTKVERTNNSVVSQGQDITNLNNSLVTVNTNINSKGKVIYSENEPSEVERLAQNLWIDTKDGNNTPKRWDGVEWIAVTDKVAAEALAKAEANSEVLTTKADASAVSSLTNKVENVEKTITSQSNDLVVLTNSLEQTSQLAADKGKVIFSNVEPKESERILQNLWIDTSNNNNTPKRWTGTKWSTVTDKVALDALTASQAVSDALTTKADSSAVSSLESKVTDLGESISSQSQDITTLNNSLVLANNTISGKGKIIYSDSAPAEGDRLPQNLWIDTTSGGNIPKRWNGEFWLVITDKTALDALAAANKVKEDLADKVDSSAFNSLTSRVNSSERAITSQSDSITKLNNDLTVTDQIAREALSDSKDLKEQITTKASTEALENLTSSVISIDGKVTTNTQKVLELTGTVEAIGENLSTKADASVLTDYSTKIDTNEAISKANTTLTSSYTKAVEDVRTETNTKLDDQLLITKASTSGKLLYADATFLKGFNSVSAYDNNSTNKVVVDRITREIDNPTKSSHQLKITIANGATPGYGGFYQLIPSRANAVFVIKYLMKVPNTYTVIPTANALGSGSSDKIIGSAAGTGKYETYVRVIRCGDSSSFSTGGHIYFYGTSLPKDSTDTVMLASIECWDATDFVKSATSDEVATISSSLVNDYYTKTDADKAVSNSLTAFQTNYVDKELNKKASANTVDQISNEIHNTETGLDATAKKLSGVYAQVNPEFIGSEKGYIGKNSGSVSVWSEYSARIEGDLALSTRIDSVKADWEGNLASVQTQTKATSDKVSSLASQITVLSSAVEGNISLVMDQYYTKVQTGQVVSQGISDFKANYVAPQLNLKASSQALEQTQSQVTEIDGKLKTTSQRTEGVYAQVNPDLVGSDSGSIGTENQNVGSWSQYSALIEGDFATSQKIDVVSAAVANNTASIKQTNTVVIDKFKSVAESLNRVETKFNDNLSSVNSVIGVWSDKDKSISKYIIDLNSLVGSNQAEITRNYLTSADTTKAITEGIDRFKTEYLSDELKKKASAEVLDQVKSAIENTETGLVATADKLDGVFVKVNPKLIGSDRDFIGSTSSSVGIWTEYSARIEEDFALGNRIDNLYVNLGKNAAAIQTVNNVLVDKTQALAKSITHIDSKFESSVGSINTKLGTWTSSESSISDYITNINSAVGKNSSSIQIQGKSIDGLSSQYTVKLDTNGRVSGFGLASNPTNQATSEFAVVADKFYIASPDTNDKGKNPFYVLTKNQVADGVTIPAGVYIDQTFIRKASIDTTHIKDASIVNAKIFDLDAAKLTTGYISAERIEGESISAKHLQIGSVTEAKFSPSVLNNYLTSNQFVSDSLSDNVLTASEKTSIKNNWEQIKNNLKFYLESAKIFDITIATPAYTDLSAYILTLNLDDTNSTQIDSELFKAKFNAWYAEEYAIRSAIDAKVKDLNKNSLNQATSATDLLNRWKANKNNTLYIDDNRIAVNMIAAENIAADSITADKIKFGGVSSQNLAEDIKSNISKGMTANSKVNELIANLDDDNILTSVEKTFLYSKWQEVEKTGAWIAWQCFNIFGSNLDKETSYDPYFNLFKNFISENVSKDGLNKSTNISTITITVDGATYSGSEAMRRMMVAYYEAENKMLSKIQELQYKYTLGVDTKVSLAASVLDKLADDNIITKQEKPALKLQYTNIINDFDDLALAASNQGISSSVFATAYNDLVNVFNLIFQDMASDTSWPGDDLRAKMRAYSDQRGFLIQRLSNDAKDKANEASAKALEALQALTKMADDNVITIYEKPALSFSWQNIINDFDDLETAGKNQQVDTADFKTAYTSLKTAVDLILANPSVNTEWSGQDLRDRMKSYADQRGSLLQRLANDAEEKANAAMSAITDAVSDRILTPSEKQQFKIKWVEEYQDFDKLKLKAQEANISSSNGNYSNYVSAFNYINDTFTPVWNSADNSQVDPTEWKTRFETLRKYKTLLENEISAKIKDIASSALSATQQLNQTVANKADSSALLSLDHDVKVIDGQVKAYGESITSLSADLSNKVGKGDVNSIIGETQNGKKHIVSTEGLDNNLYYPVTIGVTGLFSKISMLISLGEAKATWSTHSSSGWSCGLTVTQRASGWGGNSIDLTIEKFDYAWTNQSPVINVGQLSTMSSALFYVRGGSKYHFYVDSNCYAPQLWTEKTIFNQEYNIYVEPISYSSGLEPKSLKQNVQSNSVATSTLRANVDEINGKVVAQSSSILNLQTNVDTISRDLTTKANSSVLAQYYTRDEADRATAGKIENFNSSFEIGGRNYFRKTTPLNPHQLQEVRRDLPDTPNGFYVIGSQTPSNNLRLPGVITGNGKWTISGWARGSQNTAISFFIDICDKELSDQIVINRDGTNSWEKFTHTVTVDNYSSDTYNFVDISNLSWHYFFFKDIKIEKGSKATDWTPAPEDVDQKLTSIDASISTLQNTTANNTQSIATTQNQLNARFDALSVGGRNLWLNSKRVWPVTLGAGTATLSDKGVIYTGANSYVLYGNPLSVSGLDVGSQYTLSIKYRILSGADTGFKWYYNGDNNYIPSTVNSSSEDGWKIAKVTRTIVSNSSPSIHLNVPQGQVEIACIKLESGVLATDWTPAPEDIDQKFIETDANIKNTYITKSDATQAISSAKTELTSSYNKSLMDSRADGVNLINFSKMVPGYFVADGSIGQVDTDHMDMNYYSCIGDESFTCHMSAVTGSVGGVGRVLWYDSNKNLISSSDCNWNGSYAPYTFKSPVNARFYRYSMIGKYPAASIKLERGTTSTGFSFSDLDESFYRVLLIQALSGNQLLSNPDFRDNHSGVVVYDNAGTGRVTLDRVPKDPDNPSSSSHQLNCTISAGAFPGYGGFVFPIISKYNGLFATKIVMKVPVGYVVNINSNALPEGTDYRVIGSNEGTGKYETYTILCKCGVTGSQSSFGHVYFTDKSTVKLSGIQTDIVKISKLEAFDATSDKPMVSKANLDEYKQTVANQYGAISESINTISTRVNDNEAAIRVQAQSINGINAQYTIKTDVNGKVAGIGLVNSGKSSEFAVTADTFRVSNGSTDIAPFTISGNNIVFNGKVNFNNVSGRPSTITLVGTSLDLPTDQQKSITYLDKDNYSTDTAGSRGVRLTVYNPDSMQPTVNQIFDTYTPQGCAEFKSKVFGLSLDKLIVTVRSMDATLYNNQDFIDAMNKLRLDGNGINSALKYKVRTSFAGASQYFASDNSTTSVLVVDGNETGKQKPAIVMISIKDGKMIPESVSSSDGMHKLNDAAGIAINNLFPTIQSLTSLVGTEDKVKSIVRNTTEINGGNIITGSITADKLEAHSITADHIQIGSLGKDNLTDDLKNTISTSASTSSQALASASTANNKIDNLKIGGNNLVIPDFDKYSSSQTGFLVCIPQPYDIKNDITYTLSFTVEGTESVTTMGVGFAAKYKAEPFGDFWNPDNSVGKKVWTGKLSSRYSKSFFYIWINSPCTIRDIQLEEGDKATSYQKNTDYRGMRSLISDRPNDKLQNKWAYIAYKKPQPSANEMMHYGYLEGDIVSQGYVNAGNTMFSDTKFDNTYIIFRTIVTPNSVVNSGLFNFLGDDAHSIYVNGQMLYSSTLYKDGGNIPFKLFSGANNVIDVLVSNGVGGAGFSTTTALQDLGKMCAPSLTAVELETNSKLINDILSDNVITTDEKQSLLITYKQIASEFDTWRGEAEALGIDVSGQISATNKLLSNSRPYLGWVCRNDSISSSDTLNDGERTTLMNALSDYYVSNKTITKLVTEKLRGAKTKADNVTTAIKNSSNWDGVSDTLTISRNNISGGKDLANLWTNQLFDPAFPIFANTSISVWSLRSVTELQGSNGLVLRGRHNIGDWKTKFYVKPGEQYHITFIGYNYSGVGFYAGLWVTDDSNNPANIPEWRDYVECKQVGETGGSWKLWEAVYTVPNDFNPSIPLAARAHFFLSTYDYSVDHVVIGNLVIKKVIKESGIDPQLVDRSKQAKQMVDDIVSDNKITPDEKQTLLVTYKQITNDNDIWRNQAYLIGLDYTRHWNATTTLTSTNRPYLGWVCRSDALNQTDTLNAGERTTLMNAIAEYHAANQDLAMRVGSSLRTTGNSALQNAGTAQDRADQAWGKADNAQTSISNLKTEINDDNTLTASEKSYLYNQWLQFKANYDLISRDTGNLNKYGYAPYFGEVKWFIDNYVSPSLGSSTDIKNLGRDLNDAGSDYGYTWRVGGDYVRVLFERMYLIESRMLTDINNRSKLIIKDDLNIDTFRDEGKYRVQSTTGCTPPVTPVFYLENIGSADRVTQNAWWDLEPEKVWTRSWIGSWTPWKFAAKEAALSVKIGSQNLLKESNKTLTSNNYGIGGYAIDTELVVGKTYTLIVKAGTGIDSSQPIMAHVNGNQQIGKLNMADQSVSTITFTAANISNRTVIDFYNWNYWENRDRMSLAAVYWAVLVEGEKSALTEWQPSKGELGTIFSDNYITPSEKTALLATYKQIVSTNDIWRNQAYNMGGNSTNDGGVNFATQQTLAGRITSGNKPYLGWLTRSDALNTTDYLTDSEKELFKSTLSDYYSADQNLAQRVGAELKRRADKGINDASAANGAAAAAQNRADSAYNSANYTVVDNIDLDSLRTTGKYFVRSCSQGNIIPSTDNELKIWMYLVVDAAVPTRITQTAWHDQTPDKVWTRVWTEYWQPWKRQTDTQYVKNLIIDPNVNTIAADARDLLNRWKANGNGTLYIDDNSIAVNKIGANQIAAGAITTEKLAVVDFTNLWPNRDFNNTPGKLFGGNGWYHSADLWNGSNYVNGYYCTGSTYGNWETKFRVNGGQEYLLDFIIGYYSGAAPSIGLLLSNDDGGDYSYGCMVTPVNYVALGNGNWHRARCIIKIPDNLSLLKWARPWVWFNNGAGEVAIGDLTITRRNSAELIVDGSITGDKIKANTSITAPTINGGEINIGNGNFVVDQWGNLNANSGTFRGTVLAENISGTIDVASLKKSAWMGGYNLHLKHGGYIDYATYRPTVIPSRGAILSTFPEFFQVAELTYTIHLETKYALNITQFLSRVDDTLDINVYQYGSLTYTIKYTSGNRREISIPLPKGFCTLEFKVKNTKGGASGLVLLGDFVDNDAIKFS